MFRVELLLVGAITCAALTPASAAERVATLPLIEQSVRDRLVLHRSSYNYGPAIIHDGATYHLYWCGGVAGDYILHSTAPDPSGPWRETRGWWSSTFETALKPTGSAADFDGLHTCDPAVLKIGATFYLYYTGEASEGALGAVGVASSPDGAHFARLNGGKPIAIAARTNPAYATLHLTYGAGQPGVTYIAPYVYLSISDSTGSGANPGNGAGQFALRSTDPAFGRDVEELTASGWRPPRAWYAHRRICLARFLRGRPRLRSRDEADPRAHRPDRWAGDPIGAGAPSVSRRAAPAISRWRGTRARRSSPRRTDQWRHARAAPASTSVSSRRKAPRPIRSPGTISDIRRPHFRWRGFVHRGAEVKRAK